MKKTRKGRANETSKIWFFNKSIRNAEFRKMAKDKKKGAN